MTTENSNSNSPLEELSPRKRVFVRQSQASGSGGDQVSFLEIKTNDKGFENNPFNRSPSSASNLDHVTPMEGQMKNVFKDRKDSLSGWSKAMEVSCSILPFSGG